MVRRIATAARGSLLLMAAIISGCALSPGMNLDTSGAWQSGKSDLEEKIQVYDINPRTVLELEQVYKQRSVIPADLLNYRPPLYRLAPGDTLTVSVWDHPELTATGADASQRVIKSDGTFYFPFIGTVMAQGSTIEELRQQLTQRLAKFIRSPQIDVAVSRFGSHRVFLSGAFGRNEPISLGEQSLSLSELLGRVSMNLDQADLSGLKLRRGNKEYTLNLDALTLQGEDLHRIYLREGDVLHLPFNDRKKVFVMGEVVGAGRAITFKNDSITLTEALGSVAGLRPESAKASDVYVIRQSQALPDSGADIYRMNANSPVAWVMAGRFRLVPGDVVYVDTAGIVRFNRVISGVFPFSFLVQTARNLTQP